MEPPGKGPPAQVLDITGLAGGGRGVGRHEGRVWLVDGGLPGDRLEAAPARVRPRLVEARVLRVLRPGPHRRAAPCPVQDACGGCPWMALAEPAQLRWKRRLVVDALERIGGIDSPGVRATVPSPLDLAYRGKVEFALARGPGGGLRIGLHGRSGGVVDVERCPVQDGSADRVLATCRELLVAGPLDDPWLDDPRVEPRLVIRRSSADGRLLVAFRGGGGPFPSSRALARRLVERHPDLAGVVRLIAEPARRSGTRCLRLAGQDWLEERLGGFGFRLPAATFFQVNPAAAERLVARVRELAQPAAGEAALDLYAGVGVFGLVLAREGMRVTACEADPAAVECGRRAARAAGLGIETLRADVRSFLARESPGSPSVVVANPPRTGFGRGVAEAIARLSPRRIVIVSCDPPTLARDVKALVGRGYALREVVPVDLFPQTAHVEAVALLER